MPSTPDHASLASGDVSGADGVSAVASVYLARAAAFAEEDMSLDVELAALRKELTETAAQLASHESCLQNFKTKVLAFADALPDATAAPAADATVPHSPAAPTVTDEATVEVLFQRMRDEVVYLSPLAAPIPLPSPFVPDAASDAGGSLTLSFLPRYHQALADLAGFELAWLQYVLPDSSCHRAPPAAAFGPCEPRAPVKAPPAAFFPSLGLAPNGKPTRNVNNNVICSLFGTRPLPAASCTSPLVQQLVRILAVDALAGIATVASTSPTEPLPPSLLVLDIKPYLPFVEATPAVAAAPVVE
jgi:tRNA (Thr-GGU) A37 N-methylase